MSLKIEDKVYLGKAVPGSGGSAPTYYIEKSVDANGKLINGTSVINLTSVTDVGENVLDHAYYKAAFPANTTIDLSPLTAISGKYACQYMFSRCTGITSVDLSSVTTVGNYSCYNMFSGSSLINADLSSLTTISGDNSCQSMFYSCSALTIVDLSSLTTISDANACNMMFYNCKALTGIDLSSLTTVHGANVFSEAFSGCLNLASVNLSSLASVTGYRAFYRMFYGCTSLTSVNLSSLTTISGSNTLDNMFGYCSNLTSISFPAFASSSTLSTDALNNIIQGVTGCTIHFPSNLDPQGGSTKISSLTGYPNFGGTNTVLAFDLPATE